MTTETKAPTYRPGDKVHTRYHDADTAPYEVIESDGDGEWTTVRRTDGSIRTYRPWDLRLHAAELDREAS